MSVLGIIFWIWLFVSLAVLVRRRLRARASSPRPDPARSGSDADPGADPPLEAPAPDPTGPAEGAGPPRPARAPRPGAAPAAVPPAPAGSDGSGPGPAPDRPTGIVGALEGIRLPCDLAPLTARADSIDPDHVDLVTSGWSIGQLVTELTAELERLGYEVADLGGGEHLADRDGTVMRVRVHDRPALAVAADGRGFPTAPPDGIVVEMGLV